MNATIKQLSEKFKVDYAAAAGLVKFLEATGRVKNVGTDKVPGTKGKGATIWEIPAKIELEIA